MVAGVGLDPRLIITRALAENFLVYHRQTEDLAEEVNHLFGPGQPAQIAVDDDAVKAVVYKNEQIAEQPGEQFHRNSLYAKEGNGGAEKDTTRTGPAGDQR